MDGIWSFGHRPSAGEEYQMHQQATGRKPQLPEYTFLKILRLFFNYSFDILLNIPKYLE